MLVDTSAIIDGRIGDLISTGFVDRELVIPVFVLQELQRVADSTDPQRRARGRRGLEVVHDLRLSKHAVATPEIAVPDITDVDAKLVRVAHELDMPILTTDYNLNKVAQIQGVQVLNVNDLANALKPAVLPGEALRVKVIREGKEADAGRRLPRRRHDDRRRGRPRPHRRARRDRGHERAAVAERQDDLHPACLLT